MVTKKKFTGKTGGIIGNQNKTNKQKIVDTKEEKMLYKYIKPEIKKPISVGSSSELVQLE